jgi:hypothetical protein
MKALTRIVSAATATVALTGCAALVTTQALATPKPASAAAKCSTNWGVKAKVVNRAETEHTAKVRGVRAGQHACFDRLVVDIGAGRRPGYRVQYVHKLHAQGSGKVISLPGHAVLDITLTANASAKFPGPGHSVVSVTGFSALRKVVSAGSFEGFTEFGAGVRAKLPFRVEWLAGPGKHSRLVIDIAKH